MKANDLGLSIYQMRLLTCADIVRNGKEEFNMGTWLCGTARCAIGDYCLAEVSDLRLVDKRPALPSLHGRLGSYEAIRVHFGIDYDASHALFSSSNRAKTRVEVADQIEHFALHKHADAKAAIRTDVDLATIV